MTADRPVLRIVRGDPTPDELAAVTVLLAALARSGSAAQPAPPSGWTDLSLRLRRTPMPGPGAWRNSAWG
jgi:Acyl-CoA carboxylase epsilon subunit